jgi:hypothetical protein
LRYGFQPFQRPTFWQVEGFVAKAKNTVIWRSQVDAYLCHLAMSSGFATEQDMELSSSKEVMGDGA